MNLACQWSNSLVPSMPKVLVTIDSYLKSYVVFKTQIMHSFNNVFTNNQSWRFEKTLILWI